MMLKQAQQPVEALTRRVAQGKSSNLDDLSCVRAKPSAFQVEHHKLIFHLLSVFFFNTRLATFFLGSRQPSQFLLVKI